MEMTIRANSGVTTPINVFAVDPDNQPNLVAVLKEGTEALMSKRLGYISASIHRPGRDLRPRRQVTVPSPCRVSLHLRSCTLRRRSQPG